MGTQTSPFCGMTQNDQNRENKRKGCFGQGGTNTIHELLSSIAGLRFCPKGSSRTRISIALLYRTIGPAHFLAPNSNLPASRRSFRGAPCKSKLRSPRRRRATTGLSSKTSRGPHLRNRSLQASNAHQSLTACNVTWLRTWLQQLGKNF